MDLKTQKAILISYLINLPLAFISIYVFYYQLNDIDIGLGGFIFIPFIRSIFPVLLVFIYIIKPATTRMVSNIEKRKDDDVDNAFSFVWFINKWLVLTFLISLLSINIPNLHDFYFMLLFFEIIFVIILFICFSALSVFTNGLLTVYLIEKVINKKENTHNPSIETKSEYK